MAVSWIQAGTGTVTVGIYTGCRTIPLPTPQNFTGSTSYRPFNTTLLVPDNLYDVGVYFRVQGSGSASIDTVVVTAPLAGRSLSSYIFSRVSAALGSIPAGADLVLQSRHGGLAAHEVFVMKHDGSLLTQISHDGIEGLHCSVSPDHSRSQ